MDIKLIESEIPYGSNSYIVSDSDEFLIVDPSSSVKSVLEKYPFDIKKLKYIIITHSHFDHFLFLDEWTQITGVLPTVSEDDAKGLSDSYYNCYLLFMGKDIGYRGDYLTVKDGDVLKLGNKEIRVIATPGHTVGSMALLTDGAVFVGDTVFAMNSVGRCDLPGGDHIKLSESIRKLTALNKNTVVYPGHMTQTTIKDISYG